MIIRILKNPWYWFISWMARLFCMFSFKWRIYGLENIPSDGAFILVSNHQSYLDPVFCGAISHRRLCFLARDTLFTHPLFGGFIRSLNAIPIKRGKTDISTIRAVIERLKDGHAVCLFPESTRTSDGKMAAFKRGIGLLCRRAKVGVLPVVIDGAFEAWPRHKKLFSAGTLVSISFGRPIPPEQLKGMDDRAVAQLLTDTLRNMQAKIRIRHGRKPYDY